MAETRQEVSKLTPVHVLSLALLRGGSLAPPAGIKKTHDLRIIDI